jgi:hypothetical protein
MMMNNYKKRALKLAKEESEVVDIGVCFDSGKELYFSPESGTKYLFETFGSCSECNESFSFESLKISDGVTNMPWPIEYVGCYCKECFYKDSEPPEIIINSNIIEEDLDEINPEDIELIEEDS